jgi:uncharacterized protein (DUF4415 family)
MSKKGYVTYRLDPENPPPLTESQKRELEALTAMKDEDIDTTDIPELSEDFFRNGQIGRFYRPVKQQLTLRVDADVVEWFKRHAPDGKGYQTRINLALREYVQAQEKKAS